MDAIRIPRLQGRSLWYTKHFGYFCAFKSIKLPIRKHLNLVNQLRPCMLKFLIYKKTLRLKLNTLLVLFRGNPRMGFKTTMKMALIAKAQAKSNIS